MGQCCPLRLNLEYVKSRNGICKAVAVVVGAVCWGIVYIGDVMATSNEAPEINDQVLLYSGVTLPVWILTVATYILYSFVRAESIPYRFDAVISAIFSLAFLSCVIVAAACWDFMWICETKDDITVVDTGECLPPDEVAPRNGGQNLAALVLSAVLAAVYGVAAALTCWGVKCRRQEKARSHQEEPLDASL